MANPMERTSPGRKRRLRRILFWIMGSILCLAALVFIAEEIVAHREGPFLKRKVAEALSTRSTAARSLIISMSDCFPSCVSPAPVFACTRAVSYRNIR